MFIPSNILQVYNSIFFCAKRNYLVETETTHHGSPWDVEEIDDSDDKDYEPIEDLHPDIEYTDQEDAYIRGLSKKDRDIMIEKENALMFATKNDIP